MEVKKVKFENLSITDQMDFLCRKIIINSIIYYDLNENIISDKDYDEEMKLLEKIINNNRDKIKDCYYYECLKDFSSATGFDLKYKLTDEHKKYLEHLAQIVLNNKPTIDKNNKKRYNNNKSNKTKK